MKEKINKILRSQFMRYIFNAILVILIFIIALIITKTSPFGDNVLGKSDAIAQYKPMLYNFIMKIKSGTLELYSFNNALGNSFMFNYVYYLISPFNFIALLFNNADMMFLSMILIKMVLASVTMTFYANKKGASNFVTTISVISYVFSGWFFAYWYNIMWLDTFALFPLFQYALEKILKENKYILYIFVFAFIYVTNFYQAFSVLIYGIVYFLIYNLFYKKDKLFNKLKSLLLFIGSTVLSFALIYVYIYTLVLVKRQMGLGFSNLDEAGYIISSMDFIKSLFYGVVKVTTDRTGHTFPNLCVNIIVLIGAISFFFNKKISIKEKIFALIGLNLLVGCVFFKEFDYVMHMFHNVIGLTFRYSYIMSFLIIVLFIKNAKEFNLNKKTTYIILGIFLVVLLLCYKYIEFNIFIFNLISLLIIGILVFTFNNNILYRIIILLVIIGQSIFVGTYNFSFDVDKNTEGIKESFQQESHNYRILSVSENDYLNQNMYYNENVLYLYTSMSYNKVLNMVPSLGCNSGPNVMSCSEKDKLINMIFNVKNDYYLEKIYSVDKDILNVELDENNVRMSQENLIKGMTGIENIFDIEILEGKEKDDNIHFYTDKDYYLIDFVSDDGVLFNFNQESKDFSLDKSTGVEKVNIYTLNEKQLNKVYNKLSKNQINYTYYSDSLIEGEIEVDENQIIFTSIPYDEAWNIYVDDVKVDAKLLLDDSLIGIECSTGKHKIKLKYEIDYKKPICISLSILFLIIIYMIIKRKLKKQI